ncbi:MAG: hypothetical protein NT091_04110 [Candidatus Falkowbacteria bacterium]|nr:hypothetical protein [Candidatus Falkowbacteria bacterium]
MSITIDQKETKMQKKLTVVSRQLQDKAAEVDLSQRCMLHLMNQNGLNEDEMGYVLECVAEFGAKPQRVIDLAKEHAIPLEDTVGVYHVRDLLSTDRDNVSLEQIARLSDCFGDTIDFSNPDNVAELIRQVQCFYYSSEMHTLWMNKSITLFIEDGDKYAINDPIHLLRVLEEMAEEEVQM